MTQRNSSVCLPGMDMDEIRFMVGSFDNRVKSSTDEAVEVTNEAGSEIRLWGISRTGTAPSSSVVAALLWLLALLLNALLL